MILNSNTPRLWMAAAGVLMAGTRALKWNAIALRRSRPQRAIRVQRRGHGGVAADWNASQNWKTANNEVDAPRVVKANAQVQIARMCLGPDPSTHLAKNTLPSALQRLCVMFDPASQCATSEMIN